MNNKPFPFVFSIAAILATCGSLPGCAAAAPEDGVEAESLPAVGEVDEALTPRNVDDVVIHVGDETRAKLGLAIVKDGNGAYSLGAVAVNSRVLVTSRQAATDRGGVWAVKFNGREYLPIERDEMGHFLLIKVNKTLLDENLQAWKPLSSVPVHHTPSVRRLNNQVLTCYGRTSTSSPIDGAVERVATKSSSSLGDMTLVDYHSVFESVFSEFGPHDTGAPCISSRWGVVGIVNVATGSGLTETPPIAIFNPTLRRHWESL